MDINLQWWQALGSVLVVLGLSPAPWILAMLRGGLLTKGQSDGRLADVVKAHTAEVENLKTAHTNEVDGLKTAHKNEIDNLKKAHDDQVGDLKEAHATQLQLISDRVVTALEERGYERTAKDTERGRADNLAGKLVEVAQELGQTTVQLLSVLPKTEEKAV